MDDEDLIGLPTTKLDRAAQILQRQIDSRRRRGEDDETDVPPENYKAMNGADIQHGVTVGLLSQIFGMDPTTIKKKLKDCPPLMKRKAGFVYDLKVAAQYLVKPAFNAEEYLKTMKSSELPTHLQDEFWSAKIKQQKWEENAGHLWRTESVMEVLGDVMQNIKFAMQLWPDNVERALGLSIEQREMLTRMADELLASIHKKLAMMPAQKATPPVSAEIVIEKPINGHAARVRDDIAALI